MMTTASDVCQTCGVPHNEGQIYRHPFNDGSGVWKDTFKSKKDKDEPQRGMHVSATGMPFDPVLRQALMDKGVLTLDDIEAAERKIRALTAQVTPTMRSSDGQPAEETRRG